MNTRGKKYKRKIAKALRNPGLYEALHRFGEAYLVSREKAFREYDLDFDSLRQEIKEIKDKVIENNRNCLEKFTANAEKSGATVFFAETAEDANRYITELAVKKGVKNIVKSKSMVSEEIGLNRKLIASGISVNETDLGEWIVQLADQRPSHMVLPAIHMFRDQVAGLFSRETGRDEPPEIEHLVKVARKKLRKEYMKADMGITGANITVAENGSIVLVTNEGNARLVTTLPPIHVVLVGREKLVNTLEDAEKILRVLPKNATGQNITSYVTWIRGTVPMGENEKELHIVVLDNGRTRLAESETCKSALRCIRCGACANVCPVYQTIGGHVFGYKYIGAIGIILTAFYHGLDNAAELIKACIGCRACVSVCPAGIDLEDIILSLRETVSGKEGIGRGKSMVFKTILPHRKRFHSLLYTARKLQGPVTDSDRMIRHLPLFFSGLTKWRSLPSIAERSMREIFPEIRQDIESCDKTAAFYAGCLNDFVYPEIGTDLIKVLNRINTRVTFPEDQNCCGVPALYSGDRETARKLAMQNIDAMLGGGEEYIVTTCPTCTMALQRNFFKLLRDDPFYSSRALQLAEKTIDISRFISLNLSLEHVEKDIFTEIRKTVTYHDSCHLKRGAGVFKEPRNLIEKTGRKIHEMNHPDRCCGFGGSYSFTGHADISERVLRDKLDDIKSTGADCVAVDCPGCLLQLKGGLDKIGGGGGAKHTVQLLAESLTRQKSRD